MTGTSEYTRRAAVTSTRDLRRLLRTLPQQAIEQRAAVLAELRARGSRQRTRP